MSLEETLNVTTWCLTGENVSGLVDEGILLRACDCDLPMELCLAANVIGFFGIAMRLIVTLPQLHFSFKRRSVDGLSVSWNILNFTAAFCNCFFVLKVPYILPWYYLVQASYLPILELMMLIEFWLFTRNSERKMMVEGGCVLVWLTIAVLQSLFEIYDELEWLSITLWCVETFPQLFLNMKRRSTYGVSNQMQTIITIGKTTDFIGAYLLILPPQYMIMAYFSSATAIIGTVHVLQYWGRYPPPKKVPPTDVTPMITPNLTPRPSLTDGTPVSLKSKISIPCRLLLILGILVFLAEAVGLFNFALWYRTHNWRLLFWPSWVWYVVPPLIIYVALIAWYLFLKVDCRRVDYEDIVE